MDDHLMTTALNGTHSYAAWLMANVHDAVLPVSGMPVKVRQVDFLPFLVDDNGNIPNVLMGIVDQHITGKPSQQQNPTAEDIARLSIILEKLVRACMVEPRIVETQAEMERGEGICSWMIPLNDKMWLFAFCQGGPQAIASAKAFRLQQDTPVADVHDGEDIPGASKPTTGDQ